MGFIFIYSSRGAREEKNGGKRSEIIKIFSFSGSFVNFFSSLFAKNYVIYNNNNNKNVQFFLTWYFSFLFSFDSYRFTILAAITSKRKRKMKMVHWEKAIKSPLFERKYIFAFDHSSPKWWLCLAVKWENISTHLWTIIIETIFSPFDLRKGSKK